MDAEFNPYEAPRADLLIQQPATSSLPLASRWHRLCAAMLDGITLILALALFDFIWLLYREGWAGVSWGSFFVSDSPAWVQAGVTAIVSLAINWVFLGSGQTVGKRILGIRVVLVDGSACSRARYVLRREIPVHVVYMIPFENLSLILSLADVLMIFRKDRRTFHDLLAGTKVVDLRSRQR